MTAPRLYFVAAEASGDLLAREVIEAIRARQPDVQVSGIGGAEMASLGIMSPLDISPLSVLGLLEGLKAYGTVVKLADVAADAIIADAPDAVILVDSWGFMLRVAQRVRARAPHIKLVKLIGPQVWATRAGRAKTLAATVDHLLCMHEIEAPFYEPFGLKTTVIGNPALSRHQWGDRTRFRMAQGISEAAQVVLVLPGSRSSEIKRVAPALVEAARILKDSDPDRTIVMAPAANVAAQFAQAFPDVTDWATVSTNPAERYDAMAAADLALACSGTVTSELAMQGTPMIVAYKTGWVTWSLARGVLYKKRHITLLNIVSDDQEIVPEFVQTEQKPELIAARALHWLTDAGALAEQRAKQQIALSRMKEGDRDAAEIAAEVILEEAGA
ncbi:MAG: lipid-A-disaccharide synthase [Alphaproteobacteria bacterium]|nr:lipid-A-disaccharide synthase [Alphaproteobacteria bacterium]MBU2085389.1 lipid-A-disaccharide synthase [Alphaproteobacteria bacterium]MBU2141872.1 lipid-A-disaccharide synthase [Alphaproteobacteria bacterium]MBU2195756.1 lipid-A-disaccharide synthase [Alphaproteobacteria bacterium]